MSVTRSKDPLTVTGHGDGCLRVYISLLVGHKALTVEHIHIDPWWRFAASTTWPIHGHSAGRHIGMNMLNCTILRVLPVAHDRQIY